MDDYRRYRNGLERGIDAEYFAGCIASAFIRISEFAFIDALAIYTLFRNSICDGVIGSFMAAGAAVVFISFINIYALITSRC